MNMPTIPEDLVKHIENRSCVAFVGAGLSMGAGLPSWPELLRRMMDWAERHGVDMNDRAELEVYIGEGKLLMTAEEMLERLREDRFRHFMDELFQNPALQPTYAHRLITQIPFSAILTTNYDKLLESAYGSKLGVIPPVLTHAQPAELSGLLRSSKFHIVKLHGTIDDIETIILARSGYRKLMNDRPAYHTYLTTILSTKTILFLGFSLTDPDPMMRLDELLEVFKGYTGTHYALMNDIKPIEQKRFDRDYNIQIIPYTPSDPDHPEVDAFLSELAGRVGKSEDVGVVEKELSGPKFGELYDIPPLNIIGIGIIATLIHDFIQEPRAADGTSDKLGKTLFGIMEFESYQRGVQWKRLYQIADLDEKIEVYRRKTNKVRCLLNMVKAFEEAIDLDDPALFHIGLRYQRDLDSGEIPEELHERFGRSRKGLPENVNFKVERKSGEWLITVRKAEDGDKETVLIMYSVKKGKDGLDVIPLPRLRVLVDKALSLFRSDENFYHETVKRYHMVTVSELLRNASSYADLMEKERDFLGFYSRYSEKLRHRCKELDLLGVRGASDVGVQLEDVFVSLSYFESPPRGSVPRIYSDEIPDDEEVREYLSRYRSRAPIRADRLFEGHAANAILILGMPGAGKSTLLKYQTLQYLNYLDRSSKDNRREYLPIFIRLRDFVDYEEYILLNVSAYVRHEMGEAIDDGFLKFYLESGQIALFFDGLDEIADSSQRDKMAQDIVAVTRDYPASLYVTTCRLAAYPEITVDMSSFSTLTIDNMNEDQRNEFIQKWYRARASRWHGVNSSELSNRLINNIESKPNIQRLAVNPLMLTIMAIIYGDLRDLPDTRLELYEECINVLMRRRDKARGYADVQWVENMMPQPDYVLGALAYGMHRDSEIQASGIAELPLEEIEHRLSEIFIDRRKVEDDYKRDFIRRQEVPKFRRFIEERTSILVDRGMGRYGFAHQTFQEYFVAYYLNTIWDLTRLWEELRDRIWSPYWREVVLLLSEMLSRRGDMLDVLLEFVIEEGGRKKDLYHLILLADIVIQGTKVSDFFKSRVLGALYDGCGELGETSGDYLSKLNELVDHVSGEEIYRLIEENIKGDSGKRRCWAIYYFSVRSDLIRTHMERFERVLEPHIGDSDVRALLMPLMGDLKHLTAPLLKLTSVEDLIEPSYLPSVLPALLRYLMENEDFVEHSSVSEKLSLGMFVYSSRLALMIIARDLRWNCIWDPKQLQRLPLDLAIAQALDSSLARDLALARRLNGTHILDHIRARIRSQSSGLSPPQSMALDRFLELDPIMSQDIAEARGLGLDLALSLILDRKCSLERPGVQARIRTMIDNEPFFQGTMIHTAALLEFLSAGNGDLPPHITYALEREPDNANPCLRAANLFRRFIKQDITWEEELEFQGLLNIQDEETWCIFNLAYLTDPETQKPVFRFYPNPQRKIPVLFSVDSRLQGSLDSFTIPAELLQEFASEGVALSPNAIAWIKDSGECWHVSDSDGTYLIRKPYFSSISQNFEVPADLREEFRNNGFPLSENAKKWIEETGSKWQVKDGNKVYFIRKRDNRLYVCAPDDQSLDREEALLFDSDLLFSTDGVLINELDKGLVPALLRQEFRNNGLSLLQNASILTCERWFRWRVINGERSYLIERKGGKLKVLRAHDYMLLFGFIDPCY